MPVEPMDFGEFVDFDSLSVHARENLIKYIFGNIKSIMFLGESHTITFTDNRITVRHFQEDLCNGPSCYDLIKFTLKF